MKETREQIEKDYQTGRERLDKFNSQIEKAQQELQAKQAGLGTAVVEGVSLDTILAEIRKQAQELEALRQVQKAVAEKEKALRVVIRAAGCEDAHRRVEEIRPAYEAAWMSVARSMMQLWEASRKIWVLGMEAEHLSRRFDFANPCYYRSLTIGNANLESIAERVLEKIEHSFPQLYEDSQAMPAVERSALVRKFEKAASEKQAA
ncbi:MAG: hypothetical protein IMZ62_09680 [Chloroflexi bacterium]|nr:hypothetical protein [Chloroflexota bacterium]